MDWIRSLSTWGLKKSVVAVVSISAVLVSFISNTSTVCPFPAIYNFGDSNSDTGAVSAAFGQVPPPNGDTFFGRPSGRQSDGRLIIDFIADKLGLPYLNAYLDALQANFRHGANFAASGSTIQPANGELFEAGLNPLTLNYQFLQFKQLKDRTKLLYDQGKIWKIRSKLPRLEDLSKALYTFDDGQNDIHFGLLSSEAKAMETIPAIINHFAVAIEKLYQEGARRFWIHNTGPIGCLTYFVVKNPPPPENTDQTGCIKSYNEVAQEFNQQLKHKVSQLRTQFPNATLVYVDIYSVKYTLISQAHKYGFVDPLGFCCKHPGDKNASCWEKAIVNGTEVTAVSCENPSKYINWDGIHYTEAANHWIANRIVDGSFSDPSIPIAELCQR